VRWSLVALVLVAGCGRFRYDALTATPDAGIDAATPEDAGIDAVSPEDASIDAVGPGEADAWEPGVDAVAESDAAIDAATGTGDDASMDAASAPSDAGMDAFAGPDAAAPTDAPIMASDAALPPGTIVQVAAAQTAVCVRLVEGTVQCAGANSDQVLGMGGATGIRLTRLAPVTGVTSATDLRAGNTHVMVMGPPLGWGWNHDGAIGTGLSSPSTIPFPTAVTVFPTAVRLAPARTSTCAILGDRPLAWVGANSFGQLGDGTRTDSAAAGPVPGLANVTDVAGAEGHVCAVHDGGLVSCWGWGSSGQLGNGTTTSYQPSPVRAMGITDAVAIGVGQSHSCAVRRDGTLWCWGANDSGQLGDGTRVYRSVPAVVPGLTNVVEVVGGYVHTCARRSDGRLFCFGWNAYGQLGDGTNDDRSSPVPVMGPTNAIQLSASDAADFTCALYADHVVRCWGDNGTGAFGIGVMGMSNVPMAMMAPM